MLASPVLALVWGPDGRPSYLNLYLPVFSGEGQITIYDHPRQASLGRCLSDNRSFERLAWFSKGFYRLDRQLNQRGDEIVMSDLRMGLTADYVFSYAIAQAGPAGFATTPPRRLASPCGGEEDFEWLWANLRHDPATQPMERGARIESANLSHVFAETTAPIDCKIPPKPASTGSKP